MSDEKFEKESKEAAEKFNRICGEYFEGTTFQGAFRNGAKWGREFGRREAIEALNDIEAGKHLDKYEIDTHHRPTNDYWADWLTKRFAKENE